MIRTTHKENTKDRIVTKLKKLKFKIKSMNSTYTFKQCIHVTYYDSKPMSRVVNSSFVFWVIYQKVGDGGKREW